MARIIPTSCRKLSAVFLLLTIIIFIPFIYSHADDWQMFRFNASRTGCNSQETGAVPVTLKSQVSIKWIYDAGAPVYSSLAMTQKMLFVGIKYPPLKKVE